LRTDRMNLPEGGEFWLKMDLRQHQILLLTDKGLFRAFSMTGSLTATELGNQVLAALDDLGLSGEYAREKFENDEPREYNPEAAGRYLTALVNADRIFKEHKATLGGNTGPVQLWPHGFDLAFEWYGTRVERYEHEGEVQEYPSQINLGFFPGDPDTAPYFYSNPWPFEADALTNQPLPAGASWHTEGWQGTILPYDELVDDDDADARLSEYARAVFQIGSPSLLV